MLPPTANISEVKTALQEQRPEWYDQSYTINEYDPATNTVNPTRYYPLTMPWWDTINNPTKDPNYDPSTAQSGDLYPESDPKGQEQNKTATSNNDQYDTPGTVPTPTPTPTPTPGP